MEVSSSLPLWRLSLNVTAHFCCIDHSSMVIPQIALLQLINWRRSWREANKSDEQYSVWYWSTKDCCHNKRRRRQAHAVSHTSRFHLLLLLLFFWSSLIARDLAYLRSWKFCSWYCNSAVVYWRPEICMQVEIVTKNLFKQKETKSIRCIIPNNAFLRCWFLCMSNSNSGHKRARRLGDAYRLN